jgi:hypothetical protein
VIALVAAWCVDAVGASPIEIDADHLTRDGTAGTASGRVRIRAGEALVRSDTASWDATALTVGPGMLHGALDGAFVAAHFNLQTGDSTLIGARVDRRDGWLGAERLTLRPDGWSADHVRLSACPSGCPWSLTATSADSDASAIVVHGARLHVGPGTVPLPPFRLDLSRRWRLDFPSVEVGYDGLRIRQPLVFRHRAHQLRVAPELRTDRGISLTTEHRGPSGMTDARLGWDWRMGGVRGGARWSEAWRGGPVTAATSGQYATDDTYFEDVAADILTRRVPWSEARGLVGVPRGEVWVDRFSATRTGGVPMIGILGRRTEEHAGVRVDARVEGWMDHQGAPEARAQLMTDRPSRLGVVVATPRLTGDLRAVPGDLRGTAGVGVDVGAPGWRSVRNGTERLDPVIGARWEIGEPRPRLRAALGWRHVGRALAELRLSAATRPNGGSQSLTLRWQRDRVTAWGQADGPLGALPTRAMASVTASVSMFQLDIGVFHAPRVDQLRASVALRGEIHPQLAAIATSSGKLQSMQAGFSWTHRSGCAGLDVTVRQDVDRPVPDVVIAVNAGRVGAPPPTPLVSQPTTPYRE